MITLAGFYLFCFAFGFFFSVLAVFAGHFHLHANHGSGAHFHAHHGHVHGHQQSVSPFNMGTISAFLAWFGGTGYLATQYYQIWVISGLALSACAGFLGASVVFLFMAKVLMREREELNPADSAMVGVLANVSGAIRPGCIGEILFSQAGVRRAAPACSEDRVAIPNGTEVVVMRYENGIAYVRRWDELG